MSNDNPPERQNPSGSDELFRLMVESVIDYAIFAISPEGRIINRNTGAERIFGYTEAEAVGQSITIIIPPELQEEEADILRRLRAGERIEHFETVRVNKQDRRIYVSLSISPVKDREGRIVGASKIARDITERRRRKNA